MSKIQHFYHFPIQVRKQLFFLQIINIKMVFASLDSSSFACIFNKCIFFVTVLPTSHQQTPQHQQPQIEQLKKEESSQNQSPRSRQRLIKVDFSLLQQVSNSASAFYKLHNLQPKVYIWSILLGVGYLFVLNKFNLLLKVVLKSCYIQSICKAPVKGQDCWFYSHGYSSSIIIVELSLQ